MTFLQKNCRAGIPCVFALAVLLVSALARAEPPVNLYADHVSGHPISAAPDVPGMAAAPSASRHLPPQPDDRYALGAGDVLQITVYGEPELSGVYRMGPDGVIAVPLIGAIAATGLRVSALESEITRRLADGYLKNPSVSIDLTALRPFFIMGEVRTPGSYPYMGDMSVLNAVAVAGGFTYRADRKDVKLLRPHAGQKPEPGDYKIVPVSEMLLPGDIVIVEERLF